jgi:hypothetical protein
MRPVWFEQVLRSVLPFEMVEAYVGDAYERRAERTEAGDSKSRIELLTAWEIIVVIWMMLFALKRGGPRD